MHLHNQSIAQFISRVRAQSLHGSLLQTVKTLVQSASRNSVIPITGAYSAMHVKRLPSDVIIVVMQYLTARDLAALSETCISMHELVNESGWGLHARLNNPSSSFSLLKSFVAWTPYAQVRYHTITNRNWAKNQFVARPLARKWMGKLQPALAVNRSRLLVGAGNTIFSYIFTSAKAGDAPGIVFEGAYTTSQRLQAHRDITSMATVEDGGVDRTLYVGFADGALERITLPIPQPSQQDQAIHIDNSSRARNHFHGDDVVESVSSDGSYAISLSSGGTAVFMNLSSAEPVPELLELDSRGWSTHLSARSSTPYAVFGASSADPLTVREIRSSGLSPTPSAILTSAVSSERPRQSAVYGIAGAPPSSPWGHSDQIIVSGWYDGPVRVHDLRSSKRTPSGDPCCPAALLPVLSMCDPWLFEPNYSVSCGGGSSSYIAAGTARHSVVALWDVRNPSAGWSVHAPGNDSSPVYSVVLESSRLFGVTQSRPFVLDFGPDIIEDTYPMLKFSPRDEEGLKKRDRAGIGFYVTRYDHSR